VLPDDVFELPFPFSVTGEVGAPCPIVLALGGHQGEREVHVTLWSRVPLGATSKQPKLADAIVVAGPRAQSDQPLVWHIDGQFSDHLLAPELGASSPWLPPLAQGDHIARSIAACAGFLILIHSRQRPER
jgi:hypothetical protein